MLIVQLSLYPRLRLGATAQASRSHHSTGATAATGRVLAAPLPGEHRHSEAHVTATAATPDAERDHGPFGLNAKPDELRRIPLAEIHESPHNPRARYDAEALQQLADSLLQSGQLEPVLVRPRKSGGYELAAGHRRFRAAKLAIQQSPDGARFRGLGELLAIVRQLDDRELIETLNISNLQRDDIHGLEEAQGFADLMKACGYDIKKIAARIGKSERYVYDSLTLLKLIPEAKKLFLDGRFERGHAIELARLAEAWQKKALDTQINRYEGAGARGGLWEAERFETEPGQKELPLRDQVKAVSVRELKTWVNDKVRLKPHEIDPVLFPETVDELRTALGHKLKVIEITYEHVIWHEARDANAPRVYGAQSWKSATKGKPDPGYPAKDGRSCMHAVLGVVVIGPGRGEAFHVCIAKEKCTTHWGSWQKARAKRKKVYGSSGGAAQRDSYAEQQARQEKENQKREAERKRWEKAQPAILSAMAEKLKAAPAGANSALADTVLQVCMDGRKAYTQVPRGRTTEDLLRHAAFQLYASDVRDLAPGFYHHDQALKRIKSLGVDPEKIVDQMAPKEQPAKASTKPAKGAKKPAKGKKR
jgi:ParB/RepB/Spo0J family partition protein